MKHRWLLLGVLTGLSVIVSGCAALGVGASKLLPPRKVIPEYKGLAGQSVGIMVWVERGMRIDNPAMRGVPTDSGLRETSLPPGKDLSFPMYFEMASNQRPVQLIFEPRVVGWNTRIIVNLE